MTTATKAEQLQEIGQNAYSCLVDMVYALECDYDRLDDLKDDRDSHVGYGDDKATFPKQWAKEFPDDAEELAELTEEAGDCADEDTARERMQDDPLSVLVRSGWSTPGGTADAEEFELLLTTGGPAVRIRGSLNEHKEPASAVLQAQDWFTPWTDFEAADEDVLLKYAACFYYGE